MWGEVGSCGCRSQGLRDRGRGGEVEEWGGGEAEGGWVSELVLGSASRPREGLWAGGRCWPRGPQRPEKESPLESEWL